MPSISRGNPFADCVLYTYTLYTTFIDIYSPFITNRNSLCRQKTCIGLSKNRVPLNGLFTIFRMKILKTVPQIVGMPKILRHTHDISMIHWCIGLMVFHPPIL